MTAPGAGTPHRVGMIVPSSNVTMETEIPALLGRHPALAQRGVTFHSSRATLHRVDPESLRQMVAESDRCARELADARLDVVAYACLIAVMASGPNAHEAEEQRLATALAAAGSPVPVTSSAGALVRALQRIGARRVAILTPYLKPLTGVVVRYLADYGVEVVGSVSLEVADNVEVGRLDPSRLVHHVRGLDLSGADALVLSACVQMPSLAVLDEVRDQVRIPVLSAATATADEVLARLGHEPAAAPVFSG